MKNVIATIFIALYTIACAGPEYVPGKSQDFEPDDAGTQAQDSATDDSDGGGIVFETPDASTAADSGLACGSPLDVVFKSAKCGELRLSQFSNCKTISAPDGCITTAEYECESPCHSSVWMEWNGERGQVIEARACGGETSVCVYVK